MRASQSPGYHDVNRGLPASGYLCFGGMGVLITAGWSVGYSTEYVLAKFLAEARLNL